MGLLSEIKQKNQISLSEAVAIIDMANQKASGRMGLIGKKGIKW